MWHFIWKWKTKKQRMNWKWIIYSQQFRQVRVLSFWHHRFTAVFNTQLKTNDSKEKREKKMEENRKTIQLHSGINDCSVRSMDSQNKTKMHRSKLKTKQKKTKKLHRTAKQRQHYNLTKHEHLEYIFILKTKKKYCFFIEWRSKVDRMEEKEQKNNMQLAK